MRLWIFLISQDLLKSVLTFYKVGFICYDIVYKM